MVLGDHAVLDIEPENPHLHPLQQHLPSLCIVCLINHIKINSHLLPSGGWICQVPHMALGVHSGRAMSPQYY